MCLEIAAKAFQRDRHLIAVFVLKVFVLKVFGDADWFCLNSASETVRYNHALAFLTPVEGKFLDLFEREVSGLRERTDRKKAADKS